MTEGEKVVAALNEAFSSARDRDYVILMITAAALAKQFKIKMKFEKTEGFKLDK